MASIGQSITGPRFVETDEVLSHLTLMPSWLRCGCHSGLIGKKYILKYSSLSFAAL